MEQVEELHGKDLEQEVPELNQRNEKSPTKEVFESCTIDSIALTHQQNAPASHTAINVPHSPAMCTSHVPPDGRSSYSLNGDSSGEHGFQLILYRRMTSTSHDFGSSLIFGLYALMVTCFLLGMTVTNPYMDDPVFAKERRNLLEDYPRIMWMFTKIIENSPSPKWTMVFNWLAEIPQKLAKLLLDSGKDPPRLMCYQTRICPIHRTVPNVK